jgi:hypothetical protein
MQLSFCFGRDDAGSCRKLFPGDPHLRFGMCFQVLQPVRRGIFGDQIETPVAMGEPDFDFAGQTTAPASSSEIEILLSVEVIGL